ncbi:hypothetical protein [Pseudochryseolinea flava]|uniref:DUF3052 domain-containing protein n=1 Tax=Pseudochryseolinea flava TaxID=2059302 RepID=A0A364XUU5_9BACT|nr:hypothetical protein [Pseudochryseolinea flava]RAV97724.1 hypothetical protein DQQ10_27185 [Pseudochryseolinea flava]
MTKLHSKTVSQKMGVKKDSRALLVHAPASAVSTMQLPDVKQGKRVSGVYDYIHIFVVTQDELDRQFSKYKKHLQPSGTLWISWPKNKQRETDLNIKHVIKIGYDHGLVESKAISIDDTWSALKFTPPKKDVVYNNSYGKLKSTVTI